MIKITKHGKEYMKERAMKQPHVYRCGYLRSTGEIFGGCGCEFIADLNEFDQKIVGHGEWDYVGCCPECGRMIYDRINRVD